jgi:hypothetical protein
MNTEPDVSNSCGKGKNLGVIREASIRSRS